MLAVTTRYHPNDLSRTRYFLGILEEYIRSLETMRKILGATLLLISIGTLVTPRPAQAQSVFVPTVTFDGGNTVWGIENRTSLSKSISLRSFVSFANSSPTAATRYGTSLNYNLDLGDEEKKFSPFVGIGYTTASGASNSAAGFAQAGIDLYFENLLLTGSVAIPFNDSASMATSVGLGFSF